VLANVDEIRTTTGMSDLLERAKSSPGQAAEHGSPAVPDEDGVRRTRLPILV
jgi:hypothetical protein